jgi:hypothetical protein
MRNENLPSGWSEQAIRKVLAHYENQTEDQQLAEHEAAFGLKGHTTMVVPTELVPAIRALIARQQSETKKRATNRRKDRARRSAKQSK